MEQEKRRAYLMLPATIDLGTNNDDPQLRVKETCRLNALQRGRTGDEKE
jgi:hypothetical protein